MLDYSLLLEATLVVAAMSLAAAYLRLLDKAGGVIAGVIGYVVYLTIGRPGMVILIAFLVVSGLASRYKYEYKRSLGVAEEKGGTRGWRNVLGNGLFPAMSATLYGLSPTYREVALATFIGSVSAIFADTMATEVGLLYKGSPRLMIGLRKTAPGVPGAISPYGFAGIAISSAILSGTLIILHNPSNPPCIGEIIGIVLITGLVGSSVDSIAGQLLQAIYRCERCGRIVESRVHCSSSCKRVRGIGIIDNHIINIICSLGGGLTAVVLILSWPASYPCISLLAG